MIKDFTRVAKVFYKDMSHPLAVANTFKEGSDEWIVGLFHDILEDTHIDREKFAYLLSMYGKSYLVNEIESITRKPEEQYFDYIRRLQGIAKKVKKADLKHNLSRTATLKESLKRRYELALTILEDFPVESKQ